MVGQVGVAGVDVVDDRPVGIGVVVRDHVVAVAHDRGPRVDVVAQRLGRFLVAVLAQHDDRRADPVDDALEQRLIAELRALREVGRGVPAPDVARTSPGELSRSSRSLVTSSAFPGLSTFSKMNRGVPKIPSLCREPAVTGKIVGGAAAPEEARAVPNRGYCSSVAADDASGARPPVVLRIKLRYDDVDTMVQRFAPNAALRAVRRDAPVGAT